MGANCLSYKVVPAGVPEVFPPPALAKRLSSSVVRPCDTRGYGSTFFLINLSRERGETLEGTVGDHSVLSGGQESRQTLDALWQTGLVGLNFGAKPG